MAGGGNAVIVDAVEPVDKVHVYMAGCRWWEEEAVEGDYEGKWRMGGQRGRED